MEAKRRSAASQDGRTRTKSQEVEKHQESVFKALSMDQDIEWMKQFKVIRIFLIIFGRWPITHTREENSRGYIFQFKYGSVGFVIFLLNTLITIVGLIITSINIIIIRVTAKGLSTMTKTEIIEEGLTQRHTLIIIIFLGTFIVNLITSLFTFINRNEVSQSFTKWTHFLAIGKLSAGSIKSYTYVGVAFINYSVILIVFIVLTITRTSATFIGGPTVISILLFRNVMPHDYLEDFIGSSKFYVFHVIGLLVYCYFLTSCNAYMYFYLWLVKSMDIAFASWNSRLSLILEDLSSSEDQSKGIDKSKLAPPVMYHAHAELVKMVLWMNHMFAYALEAYCIYTTVKIVYEIHLTVIVLQHNDKLEHYSLGKHFIRKKDYILPLLLIYENCAMLITILMAGTWLEDTATGSYDMMREHCLLNGTSDVDVEFVFYRSMFQSYISPTKMGVFGAQYFSLVKYTLLIVGSAIVTNFMVVHQFEPLFDMDTSKDPYQRIVLGYWLAKFEDFSVSLLTPEAGNDTHRTRFGSKALF